MSLPRTRMGMLTGRARLGLARQGQALLERKRDALLRELYREVPIVFAAGEELTAAAGAARLALTQARTWLGGEPVAAAATASVREISLELDTAIVMGLAVPAVAPRNLVRGAHERGREPLATGAALELVAQRFEEEATVAIRVATIEARVRRLAGEIRRTNSRVNALRTRIIPGLEAETRAIALALDQREREDRHRFKRVKELRAQA
ncbi:MAG TPA: V-type ATP synthase subunit D [Candidatus Limnocylindria bacterium]